MNTDTELKTLSIAEVGAALGYGRTSIYRMVRAGKIPAFRLGRKLRIPRRAIEQMVESALTALPKPTVSRSQKDEL